MTPRCRQLVLLTFLSLASSAAQLTEENAKQRVFEFVRAKAGLEPDHFLRAMRNEDLEDQLFSAQMKIAGKIRKAAQFYRVTETGYEVVPPTRAVLHTSTDGQRIWQVAIDPVAGTVVGLGGFGSEGRESFNELAILARVRIDTEDTALNWAVLYVQTALQEKAGTLVTSAVDLRRRVEDVVEAYRLSRKRPISAKQWMDDLAKSKATPVYGMKAMREADGFRVLGDSLAATEAHEPQLVRLSFLIAGDGRVTDTSMKPLFPKQ
ncbi:MAG: hypothetical protein ACK6DZ_24015 [Acidobacteriota bacterium]|jgi:hypothetical protein|nr:hypothetical protein [Rickettsiales bacterium]